MTPTIKIDYRNFQRELRNLSERKRGGVAGVLKQQARLLTGDLLKFTPPFDPKSPIASSFNSQRKMGENAVKRDVERGQKDIRELDMIANGSPRIKKLLRKRDLQGLENVLRRSGFRNANVFSEATVARHNSMRTRYGIIRRSQQNFVLNGRSIKTVEREKLKGVGKAKAGWKPAATRFGPKIPAWISRHGGQGSYTDRSMDNFRPYIEVVNSVPHIQSAAQTLRIVQRAIDNRVRNMQKELGNLMEREARRASARMAA